MKDYKKEAILGPVFKLIEAILELFIPIVMAKIIDIGVANKDIAYVFKMGGLLILLGAIGLALSLIHIFIIYSSFLWFINFLQ